MENADTQNLPPTVELWPRAAGLLGIGRSKAYDLALRDQFPVRVLRIGRSYRVSRADLLRYLGEERTSGCTDSGAISAPPYEDVHRS